MNQERRETIVREISHWRRSKLLPEQYCDFLLNLYVDPDEPEIVIQPERDHSVAKAVRAIQKATGKQWLLTIGLITFISFVVLYFNSFHYILQISVVGAAVVSLLVLGQRIRRHNEVYGLLLDGSGMLLLLISGMYMLSLHGIEEWGYKAAFLAFCAIIWIIFGIKAYIPALHLGGWIGLILVYSWLLFEWSSMTNWYEVQLFWVPLAGLFSWASWLVHRWTKPVSGILLVVCALLWFMPEIYSLLLLGESLWPVLQLQLIGKVALGGILLFITRKKWMEWVV